MSSPAVPLESPSPAQAPAPRTVVHKFGGTSVADAERYRHVARLLLARAEPVQVTVVSAMKGVTDALIELAELAAADRPEWHERWHELRARHRGAAVALLGENAGPALEWLEAHFEKLSEILSALAVIGELPREVLDRVQGLGEVYSAQLLGSHLQALGEDCAVLDAREVLVVNRGELGVDVDWSVSARKLGEWRAQNPQPRVVATGFVARDRAGRITTLGRNGSDYSGAIFAALFEADELHIWTDVDGVLSADPRVVPEAVQLETLSYDEACELAYFGAKVVHPQTMSPAIERGLPIIIRNTFQPGHPGTRITANSEVSGPIKGLTLSPGLAVLNLEGTGLIGVPGTAERVFAALRNARVSVVMISQGSSEHSICCVVKEEESARAQDALLHAFAHELAVGQVQRVQLTTGISVLAAVGDGMAGQPGVAARLFESLGRAQVNILAIAQGSSERNISVAIDSAHATKALRAAHAGFWLSPQTFSVGVIGPGNVGAALLDQLRAAQPQLLAKANLDLRLRAIASRGRMLLDERGLADDWRPAFAASATPTDLDRFTAHLQAAHLPHAIIIDCSGSPEVADRYAGWLAAGIHVVTPNKQAGSGPLGRFLAIREAAAASGARFRYEATVGAGLPVITTLRDLVDTGDAVTSIEGIFSGTLAWLFNKYDGSVPFSELVAQARAMGYTEPDPRDDLSGVDVARKLVILAREAGREVSLEDVEVESLVPAALKEASVEEFMARLREVDAAFAQRLADARSRGNVLRYVAQLPSDGPHALAAGSAARRAPSVGLVELPAGHGFANLRLTDNVVQFTTRRYCENPLVVQGPGAGPEVTAAGVFADVLRVAAGEGARL
ncbi:bifunctional aspartate kinase/homoserine dehydrogenase I [[Pseudomonas] boreopolis]|uniref:bifunctional aspartate kinase/homoserine dehydrogenase I n=1 Tax=Xanthomonas boreopolis TaxID=86183 RepID=UPI003D5AF102